MTEKLLKTHNFVFNPQNNGGESLVLKTEFFDNGDGIPTGIYTNQTLKLTSYGNSASISLGSATISPKLLRKLADELEEVWPKEKKFEPKFRIGQKVNVKNEEGYSVLDKSLNPWKITKIELNEDGKFSYKLYCKSSPSGISFTTYFEDGLEESV